MYHTLAVFCSNFFIHLFIYLLDYKDEVDRRVFKKKIETKAGCENTFKTGSDMFATRTNRHCLLLK